MGKKYGIIMIIAALVCAAVFPGGKAAISAESAGPAVWALFDDDMAESVTNMPDAIEGRPGEIYEIPAREPAREGYTFEGWIINGTDGPVYRHGGANSVFVMPDAGIVFVAQWSENQGTPGTEPTPSPTINPGTEPTAEPTPPPTINPGTVPTMQPAPAEPTEPPRPTNPPATSAPQQPTNPPATSAPQQPTNPPATGAPQEPTNPPATSAPQQPTNPPATSAPQQPTNPPATSAPQQPTNPPAPSPTKKPGGFAGGGGGGGSFGTGGTTTTVRVVKEWEDDDNSRGERPESVTVRLLQNGTAVDQCVLSAENNWQHTFTSLRSENEYTVAEEEVNHYSAQYISSFGGYRIINRYDESAAADQNNDRPSDTPTLNYDDHFAYIVGYEDGTVRPDGTITRAEVATIFFRMLSDDSRGKYFSKTNSFGDVSQGDWFNTAVSTMAGADVIHGYEDGTFRGDDPITRAEFAVIAANFDSATYGGADKFGDIGGHWAREYINRAADRGWINGYEDRSFRPDQNITRAEAMALVNRVLGRKPSAARMLDEMTVWPDNRDRTEWYYADIQEATNSHYCERADDGYETWTFLRPDKDWKTLEN